MTRKTFEAARDCASKINGLTPTEEKIHEMFSFLSMIDRLAEICEWEGPSGLLLEADSLPANTPYEKTFKESVYMWLNGSDIAEASDHAAERYFADNPVGYDAAIYFASVFSVGNILNGELSYSFIDQALQYLLPDGWRWREEDEKEAEAHKDDKDWFPLLHSHRKTFIGEPRLDDKIQHRFDDVRVCDLLTSKDPLSEEIGRRIADRLPDYADGALQLILKELTYPELEKALYVLPEEAEDRIISNINSRWIPIIKGDCILNKDTVNSIDIRKAVTKLENALNDYTGDPALEAGYEG